MDDIWIISWFNHIAFDANSIWKSPKVFKNVDPALQPMVIPDM